MGGGWESWGLKSSWGSVGTRSGFPLVTIQCSKADSLKKGQSRPRRWVEEGCADLFLLILSSLLGKLNSFVRRVSPAHTHTPASGARPPVQRPVRSQHSDARPRGRSLRVSFKRFAFRYFIAIRFSSKGSRFPRPLMWRNRVGPKVWQKTWTPLINC